MTNDSKPYAITWAEFVDKTKTLVPSNGGGAIVEAIAVVIANERTFSTEHFSVRPTREEIKEAARVVAQEATRMVHYINAVEKVDEETKTTVAG